MVKGIFASNNTNVPQWINKEGNNEFLAILDKLAEIGKSITESKTPTVKKAEGEDKGMPFDPSQQPKESMVTVQHVDAVPRPLSEVFNARGDNSNQMIAKAQEILGEQLSKLNLAGSSILVLKSDISKYAGDGRPRTGRISFQIPFHTEQGDPRTIYADLDIVLGDLMPPKFFTDGINRKFAFDENGIKEFLEGRDFEMVENRKVTPETVFYETPGHLASVRGGIAINKYGMHKKAYITRIVGTGGRQDAFYDESGDLSYEEGKRKWEEQQGLEGKLRKTMTPKEDIPETVGRPSGKTKPESSITTPPKPPTGPVTVAPMSPEQPQTNISETLMELTDLTAIIQDTQMKLQETKSKLEHMPEYTTYRALEKEEQEFNKYKIEIVQRVIDFLRKSGTEITGYESKVYRLNKIGPFLAKQPTYSALMGKLITQIQSVIPSIKDKLDKLWTDPELRKLTTTFELQLEEKGKEPVTVYTMTEEKKPPTGYVPPKENTPKPQKPIESKKPEEKGPIANTQRGMTKVGFFDTLINWFKDIKSDFHTLSKAISDVDIELDLENE